MQGPCNWEMPPCTCVSKCLEADPTTLQAAMDWSTLVLWAATGRRFGLCEITVRPCGVRQGHCVPGWGWGASWSGGFWLPYIGSDGLWRNCGCKGFCSCKPNCEAYLLGPVHSVTEVVVNGEVVDSGTYEVQDGHWLVRTEGCWPECPDMASSDAFEVTYFKGEEVPAALAVAARVLACEFVKACTGGECRLPGRLQFITRQGVTAQMVDVERLLDRGMTGVTEVDQVVAALNPYAIKSRPRVWTPDLPHPRLVTVPQGS